MSSSLQAITASISSSGLRYFVQEVVATRLCNALGDLEPPSATIPIPAFQVGFDKYNDVTVELSKGRFDGLAPAFSGLTQSDDGEFHVTLTSPKFQVYYNWTERFQFTSCSNVPYAGIVCQRPVNEGHGYLYSLDADSMTITVELKLSYASSAWRLEVSDATATTQAPHPNIPQPSVVNHQETYGCFQTRVAQSTVETLQKVDFDTPIQDILEKVLFTVPASGHLTPDIVFEFGTGPSGLSFPQNSGVSVGVTGQVAYKGTPYPGQDPPTLALPAVPKTKHLALDVADYGFDALFWGFYSDGILVRTVRPGDLPDPSPLQTETYRNGPLQALPEKYPNTTMTAYIKALQPPTAKFLPIYDLSKTALSGLHGKLPEDILDDLAAIAGLIFLGESEFYSALTNALGTQSAEQYKQVIEAAAQTNGAAVTHQVQTVLSVLHLGKSIPVLTFDVEQTDVLQEWVLGVAPTKTTQTLQFAFQVVPSSVTTQFISSSVGIKSGNFGYIWNGVLEPQYANEVAQIGKEGIALPRIHGFDFVFDQAQIAIADGFVSVLTDLQYVGA